MASNITHLEVSKTYSNIILSNVDEVQPDVDGIPFDLASSDRRAQGTLQDGLGNSSPLRLSQTAAECTAVPGTPESLIRKQEILEGITYVQTASLIYS